MGTVFFFVQGYLATYNRRRLIVENYNEKKSFESWKQILDICHEGVIMYRDKNVIYCNAGLKEISKRYKLDINNVKIYCKL